MRPADYVDRCLAGEVLYGDDFTLDEAAAWFEEEREGFADLGAKNRPAYGYGGYERVNVAHGFRYLPDRRFEVALGIGAAYGDELRPVLGCLGKAIIVEPSAALRSDALDGLPLEYRSPLPGGNLPCDSSSVDLVTCFGVLHHIPNVSNSIREIGRVLRPGGFALIREPTVSMGDWRRPRRGVTRNERGIPLALLSRAVSAAGLEIVRESPCFFPLTARMWSRWPHSRVVIALDAVVSRLTAWNRHYHAKRIWQKLAPSSVMLVLRRTR